MSLAPTPVVPKKRVLLIAVHPTFHQSMANRALYQAAEKLVFVRPHLLYEEYPDFQIDQKREQQLLLDHDVIAFLHPFYWYSTPALLKEWQDVVLEYAFAYGPGGDKLKGKKWMQFITTGGAKEAYRATGVNRFEIHEFLKPFEQTAALCQMDYQEPWILHSAMDQSRSQMHAAERAFLERLEQVSR